VTEFPPIPSAERQLESMIGPSTSTAKDDQVAALEDQVQQIQNDRYEERFLWFLVALVLFDAMLFVNMENWSAPVVIGVLELLGVLIMADRCRVDTVAPLIDRLTGAFENIAKGRGRE
jgi:hypothetical protein